MLHSSFPKIILSGPQKEASTTSRSFKQTTFLLRSPPPQGLEHSPQGPLYHSPPQTFISPVQFRIVSYELF